MYVLTSNGLYKFDPGNQPATMTGPIPITGLPTGYAITSIDFSPTGQLYGLGKNACNGSSLPTCARVFAIDKVTGAATQIGISDFQLINGGHELEYDPVTNTLHVIGSIYQEHHVINLTDGYATFTSFKEGSPFMKGVAFSNNFPDATTTTLYAVGTDANLHTIGGLHGDPAPSMTAISLVGNLNPDPNAPFVGVSTERTAFDISQRGNAYMISDNNLSSINLRTGEASLLGIFSFATINDFSMDPETLPSPVCSFTITVTPQPPTVTINKAAGQFDPTTSTPVKFTVVFSEEVTSFDASDISFAGSTVPGTLTPTITGSGATYNVSVTGFTGAGNIVASVNAGAAVNNDGTESLASTSTDNIVAVAPVTHDIFVVKTAQAPVITAGGAIIYEIDVVRPGFGGPVQNVIITDVLPAGAKFLQFTPLSTAPFQILSLPLPGQNGTISLLLPFFNPGQVFSFRLMVGTDALSTGSISNTATISGPLGDVNPANNSATAIVLFTEPPTITCPGDMTVNVEPDKCGARVSFPSASTVTATGVPAPKFQYKIEGEKGSTTSLELNAFPESIFF